MEYKETFHKLVDLDKIKGIVQVYWSAFDNQDSDGDVIINGAYTRTIEERGPRSDRPRIKFLWQHIWTELRGIPTDLIQDNIGLLATCQVTLGRPNREGEDLLILYDAGVITEHSIGIDLIRRENEDDQRIITSCRLWEGSPVTWGANPLTPYVGMKTHSPKEWTTYVDTQIKKANRAMNSGITDELARGFENWRDVLKMFRDRKPGADKHSPGNPTNNSEEERLREISIKLQSINRQLNYA